jgi:rhomboid protease GluP
VIGVKAIDLLLAMRNGLAVIVGLLALGNAGLVVLIAVAFPAALAQLCRLPLAALANAVATACVNPTVVVWVCAAIVLIATLLACRSNLVRGLTDVGFVGNSLRAERARRSGL